MFCRLCVSVIDFPCDDCGENAKFCPVCGEGLVNICCDKCKHAITAIIANSIHPVNFCQFCGESVREILATVMKEYWLNKVVEKTV